MKKLMSLIFLMIVGVFFEFPEQGHSADMPTSIHIGDSGAFTGDAAGPCMETFNSAQVAVDEWNEKGGILGVKIAHIMGDTSMDPAQAVNVAHKFCSDNLMYGAIGPVMSHLVQATLKIYNGCNLAQIATAATKPDLTQQGCRNFFRVGSRDDANGRNVAKFIVSKFKAKRIAVVNEKTAYCDTIASEAIKGFKELGIQDKNIMQEIIVGGAKDYSPVLTKVKSFNADVLFFVAQNPPDNAIGVRQTKELGLKAVFFGADGARDKKDFIQASEGAAEGTYLYHYAPDVYAIPRAASYIKRFEAKYGSLSGFGPPAYEGMNILLMAIEKAAKSGKLSREEVVKNISKTKNYEGVLGFPVTFDKDGDLVGGVTYIYQVISGDFKQIAVVTGK